MDILAVSQARESSLRMIFGRASRLTFLGVWTLCFVASVWMTIAWSAPMSTMDDMPMPGGWTMSMTWMRMPGQTWLDAAASFLGMWVAMMAAMMLPSLLPVLWRYRSAVSCANRDLQTMLMVAGYFCVWSALGIVAFPLGAMLAAIEMQWSALARAVPVATGVIVLLAGALQFTAWKAHHLACCRAAPGCLHTWPMDARAAWQCGMQLGLHCSYTCSGFTVMLLVVGMMDLRVMAAVTILITLERFTPDGGRAAKMIGAIVVAAGLLLIARAIQLATA